MNPERAEIHLLAGHSKRLRQGHPWIFSNEIRMDEATKRLPKGTLATVIDAGGERLGVATFNPHSLIAGRLLSADPDAAIDEAFFAVRLSRALALRAALYAGPHYRLIHAEADGLPGLVIDRYGDVLAVQLNSAGMESLVVQLTAALKHVLSPRAIVLRRDSGVRELEGLARAEAEIIGTLEGPVEIDESGVRFLADLGHGQKTGWYYDQRDNRDFVARLARDRRVLDLYCHTGGFALRAAVAGAADVLAIDSSQPALAFAERAAALNGVAARVRFEVADVFDWLAKTKAEHAGAFGLVIADPPAFAATRKTLPAGLKAYRKLTRLAAGCCAREAYLVIASCSHHVDQISFLEAVHAGLRDAGRVGRLIRIAGAGPDHPAHTALPESTYLKCAVLALD
ncbi:MAG: class I SAM-dependent rRNA methyltransferase [Alphaproteobacteria bacterium]|nr:class I SAM-dependent rRNA methyltransferase [Alphaproteobacteria bacterium]